MSAAPTIDYETFLKEYLDGKMEAKQAEQLRQLLGGILSAYGISKFDEDPSVGWSERDARPYLSCLRTNGIPASKAPSGGDSSVSGGARGGVGTERGSGATVPVQFCGGRDASSGSLGLPTPTAISEQIVTNVRFCRAKLR